MAAFEILTLNKRDKRSLTMRCNLMTILMAMQMSIVFLIIRILTTTKIQR